MGGCSQGDQEIPPSAWQEQPFPNLHKDQQQEESGCPRKPDPTESDSRPSLGNRVGAGKLFMGEDLMV